MSKIAVVYWSGTGNTAAMAEALAKGAKKSAEVTMYDIDQKPFVADTIADYDGIMFGCPAMGDEVLEESSFEPMFADVESKLGGVPVLLFGSYGWGGGAWMRNWENRVKDAEGKLFAEGLTAENTPDDATLAQCEKSGEDFAKSL